MLHFNNCEPWRQGYYPFRPHTIQVGNRRSHVEYGWIDIAQYTANNNMKAYATATDSLGYSYIVYADDSLESMTAFPVDIYGNTPNSGRHKDMKGE